MTPIFRDDFQLPGMASLTQMPSTAFIFISFFPQIVILQLGVFHIDMEQSPGMHLLNHNSCLGLCFFLITDPLSTIS